MAMLVGVLAAIVWASLGSTDAIDHPETSQPGMFLADVDDKGALIVDSSRQEIIGASRRTGVLWRSHQAFETESLMCSPACPAAVASRSGATSSGERTPLRIGPDGATTQGRDTLVLPGSARVEYQATNPRHSLLVYNDPAGEVHTLSIGPDASWFLSSTREQAVILRPHHGTDQIIRLTHIRSGWVVTKMLALGAKAACVSDGVTALLADDHVLVLRRGVGATLHIADVGACRVADGYILLARLVSGAGEPTLAGSTAWLYSEKGTLLWQRSMDRIHVPSLSPVAGMTVMMELDRAVVIDTRGELFASYDDIADAQYTADGELVLLHLDGTVRWVS